MRRGRVLKGQGVVRRSPQGLFRADGKVKSERAAHRASGPAPDRSGIGEWRDDGLEDDDDRIQPDAPVAALMWRS